MDEGKVMPVQVLRISRTAVKLASSCCVWWTVVSVDIGPPLQIMSSRSM